MKHYLYSRLLTPSVISTSLCLKLFDVLRSICRSDSRPSQKDVTNLR